MFAELAATLLTNGKALRFKAKGFSMHPLVRNDDILMVNPVNPQDIRLADAVMFTNDFGRAVLHRVIRKKHQDGIWFFWLQGDQAHSIDGIIPQEQILGKLTRLERDNYSINTNEPIFRLLSVLVVIRARFRLGRTIPYKLFSNFINRFKVFNRYIP